jgi:beta-aspartyl-peptidase (threonine type)
VKIVKDFVIVGTIRSNIGLPEGIKILQESGTAIDAVEKSIIQVEDNLEDWTVGSGGLPNLLGEVELDASIMEGRTLQAGAVAGVKHYPNPISIARSVMEKTPHVLLVGDGADTFAGIMGYEKKELLTKNAKEIHRDFLMGKGIVEKEYDTKDSLKVKENYYKSFQHQVKEANLMSWYEKYSKENHGTVNVIAKDNFGNICSGVSTSGLSFKIPGRAGDSPIIGAGNYTDNRFGAAACVGVGEIAIRLSLARIAVYELSKGATVEEAATNAIKSISDLEEGVGSLSILVMDKNGESVSAANFKDYYYWMADSETIKPVKQSSIFIDTSTENLGVGYHR